MTRVRKQNNSNDAEPLNAEPLESLHPSPEAIASPPVDGAIASGVDRLMAVIEQTVANVGGDADERQMLRQGVTTIVQDTLLEFLRPQDNPEAMRLTAPMDEALTLVNTGSNGTTGQAIDATVRGSQQVGMAFVDFTQGLISGTFSSIIKATIDQMKAYSDMVADLTKSLKEFASDNVSEDAVGKKLAQLTFEESIGGKSQTFEVKQDQPRRGYHLKRLYYMAPLTGGHRAAILKIFGLDDLVNQDGTLVDEDKVKPRLEEDQPDGIVANSTKTYLDSDITTIRSAIKHGLARDGMNQLRQMAREGMARIVITEGEINTKLIFRVSSDESTSTRVTNTNRNSYGGSIRAGAFWGWGSAGMNANYNQLSVSTVDQTTVGNIETLTQMSGQVSLKFKTDYKPLNDGTNSIRESDLAPVL